MISSVWQSLRQSIVLAAVASVTSLCAAGTAVAQRPFYEQEPYDVLTLNKDNDNAVLKVEPLDLPDRRVPQDKLRTSEKLTVRLFDRPGETYEVRWYSIEKIELFEELVLREAVSLVRSGRLSEAYDYFQFLRQRDPTLPGLAEALDEYLYEEAKVRLREGQFDGSLAMLRELHHRNPSRPDLDKAIGLATDSLVAQYVESDSFVAARKLIARLSELYPNHPIGVKWRDAWKKQAADVIAEARRAQEAGNLREADRLGWRAALIAPSLPEVEQYLRALHAVYPRVRVGVIQKTESPLAGSLTDWPSRRVCRLLERSLVEYVGPGPDGGRYETPFGKLERRELGLRLTFLLDHNIRSDTATLTGYDLSQRLLSLADPLQSDHRPLWADLLRSVAVEGVFTVHADLAHPHVRPEALLQVAVVPGEFGTLSGNRLSIGPYLAEMPEGDEVRYVANPQYFAATPTQPKEIAERYFGTSVEAMQALRRREIDVLDRVCPWELKKLREEKEIAVERYAAPLVHCLVPNLAKPVMTSRELRRAIVYAIDRQTILNRLLGGAEMEGCAVVSGPFSQGIAVGDGLDYGYNSTVKPRPYDPRLAMALAQLGLRRWIAIEKAAGRTATMLPPMVLAHPAYPTARAASKMIQKQLEVIGLTVEVRELPDVPLVGPMPEDIDLLYVEAAMWEPVIDARRLLDVDGLAGSASPYMSLALRRLDEASEWRDVADRLRQIHRIAADDVAVVPLWQMTDHFAYYRSLKGAGKPVTLYDNVESWQSEFAYRVEQ